MVNKFLLDVLKSLDVEDAPFWKQAGALLMCFIVAWILFAMLYFAALLDGYPKG